MVVETEELENMRKLIVLSEGFTRRKSAVSSQLATARSKMSALELKAFYQISTLIKMDDNDLFEYEINMLDFADAMGVARESRVVQRLCKSLLKQVFEIEHQDGDWKIYTVFSSFCYNSKTNTLKVSFNSQMRKFLLELKRFTKIDDIRHIKAFDSKYTIRFYVLFKDRLNLGFRNFNIEDLATMFELPKSYLGTYTNLYERVIAPAIREINAKSDIWVRGPEVVQKNGRRIHRIRFVFGQKSSAKWRKCGNCGSVSKVEAQSEAEKLIAQISP